MTNESDWQAVQQEMTAEDRRKLGEPPTADEMLAYTRGELPAETAARVRAWLVCNPDLARALMQPFPDDDAKPGDPDFLSPEELSKHWASLQQRIHAPATASMGRLLQFPSRWTALAASLALVFAGLYWQAESKARRLDRQLHEPRALESQLLLPDGRRGVEQATSLTANGEHIVLDLALFNASRFETYRVEMSDETRPPWRSAAIRAADEETLSVDVSRAYLKPGKYRIVVYGIEGAREERLDSYTLRVP